MGVVNVSSCVFMEFIEVLKSKRKLQVGCIVVMCTDVLVGVGCMSGPGVVVCTDVLVGRGPNWTPISHLKW